jgi:hypothetical protein
MHPECLPYAAKRFRALAQRDPSDRDVAFDLAATEAQLGNSLRVQGNAPEAVALLRLASSRLRALISGDANDVRPRRALAGVQTHLTVALGALREAAEPEDWGEVIAAIESAMAYDPGDIGR